MDQPAVANNTFREDGDLADKMKLDSFRLGRPLPSTNYNGPKLRHARSHSRNGSVSVPLSFSSPSVATLDGAPSSPTRSSLGAPKRNSHHRRRSSVSTRRESADMMGVSLPSIAPSAPEDNINLGDKDSIRRRALWTLEGKTDVGDFAKVEIPEFETTETTRRSFELPSKPLFPPGLSSKRDSFGKFMASASSKEQLHTLVEEEEEEEEVPATVVSSPVQESPAVQEIPAQETSVQEVPEEVPVTSPSPRHRPASLNLRPLSLAQMATSDLPTPVLTPSPSARPGLRSLTLGSSPAGANKRQSLILTQSPSPMSNTFARRSSLNIDRQASAPLPQPFLAGNKRTSIPYVSSTDTPPQSVIGLPTPEMTPTTAERPLSSPDAGAEAGTGGGAGEDPSQILATRPTRPLSVSEQHFLFQAHATLVQRITDLERALSTSRSSRSWSRSMSCASEASMASTVSMSAASEPNDEMLQLLADLKAERDELRLDVDGWRARVADLEHQVGMYAKRVEAERRDAWVARERVGLLEAEKGNLEKFLNDKVAEAETLQEQVERAKEETRRVAAENEGLKSEMDRMLSFEEECARLKEALYAERNKREDLEKDLEHAGLLNTPRAFDSVIPQIPAAISRSMFAKARGLGFQSIDSESSVTDVDSVDSPRDKHEFGLNAVAEEDEETLSSFSEEDELARFEDEEEGDEYAFPMSMSASSFGSADDNVQLTPNAQSGNVEVEQPPSLTRANTSSPTSLPTPIEQTHARRASLQKAWSFSTASTSVVGQSEEIDRFFGCLEDVDNSPPLNSVLRSVESDKNLFSQALANDEGEDELPPFVLPADVGVEVVSPPLAEEPRRPLDVVVEEDEEEETREDETKEQGTDDEFVGEIDEGGIKFTFTIPPEFQVATEPVESLESVSTSQATPSAPVVMNPFEEEDSSFTFPQSRSQQNSSPTPSAIPRLVQSRSSAALGSNSSSSPIRSSPRSSPSKLPSPSSAPTKRSTPSFIPQPRGKSPAHGANMVSFIPQPRRSPSPASCKSSAIPIVSPPTSASSPPTSSPRIITSKLPPASPTMNTNATSNASESAVVPSCPPADANQSSSPSSSFMSMSPTLAARLSFQTLTNYMPSLPWSPRSATASATVAAAAAAAAMCLVPDSPNSSVSMTNAPKTEPNKATSSFVNAAVRAPKPDPQERGYVQREKQLEKLKLRLDEERRLQRQGAYNVSSRKPKDKVLHA